MKSQQELFDDLYKEVRPERYSIVLRKLADVADEKTFLLRETRNAYRGAATRAENIRAEAWKEAWVAARDEMFTEGESNERTQ